MDTETTIMLGFAAFVLAIYILLGLTNIKPSIGALISLAFGIIVAVMCKTDSLELAVWLIIILTVVAIIAAACYRFRK